MIMNPNEEPKYNYSKYEYTVTEVTESHITVEFQDGSTAEVPVYVGESRAKIVARINDYYHPPEHKFESIESVPFSVGETSIAKKRVGTEVGEGPVKKINFEKSKPTFTYEEYRKQNYPKLEDQVKALIQARNGDTSAIEAIEVQIAEVDLMYPPDLAPMNVDEHGEYLERIFEL